MSTRISDMQHIKQQAIEKAMAIVANNIANVKTPAYKAQRFIMEHDKKSDTGDRSITPLSFNEISRDPADGDFRKTGYELHAALTSANVMFGVKTDKGIRYTRNGSFKVDNASGMLINSNNQAILDANGSNIFMPKSYSGNVSITSDGVICVDNKKISKLGIFNVRMENAEWDSNDLFYTKQPATNHFGACVLQGVIEESNVNMIKEFATMMELSKAYKESAKIISNAIDRNNQSIDKLAQTV